MRPAGTDAPIQRHEPEIQREEDDGRALLERERHHGKGDAPRQDSGEQDYAVLKIHGNSKEAEVYYAIIKAIPYIRNNVTQMIADAVTHNEELFKTAESAE